MLEEMLVMIVKFGLDLFVGDLVENEECFVCVVMKKLILIVFLLMD